MLEHTSEFIRWFRDLSRKDIPLVGGKNASLGELVRELSGAGVRVPDGFAVTAPAYRKFIEANNLGEVLDRELKRFGANPEALADVGRTIREKMLNAELPAEVAESISQAHRRLTPKKETAISLAVRSSATAEDLPEASFAGQLETFLNIKGEDALLEACRKCFASLYTDRAISYRCAHGFDQTDVAVSVGVQRMVRSDKASSGVMFSIDTDSGFPNIVLINGAWGLGETVVQGVVDPDEFEVFKPLLSRPDVQPIVRRRCGAKVEKMIYDASGETPLRLVETTDVERKSFVLSAAEILSLGRWAVAIENHYGCPMDMEWAKDGETGELFIVQARPETVHAHKTGGQIRKFRLTHKPKFLLTGSAIGEAIAAGPVCKVADVSEIGTFRDGSVLVARTTDPDWVPIMKKATAIVTEHGGRTSHAAIVSRELGVPAIVGAAGATELLNDRQDVTVSCAEGETGFVYDGLVDFDTIDLDVSQAPETRTKIMFNVANPSAAYRWWRLPSDGVGLARIEFIIGNLVKAHPMALARFDQLKDDKVRQEIDDLTAGFESREDYFVERLAEGVARIAAAHYPEPVIVRLSDFKTNEYASLLGGAQFEPAEDNPMLGWRGASRYYHDDYREGFALECKAMKQVREAIGLANVKLMIPFCRTIEEADKVLEEMARNGLKQGDNGLEIFVMAEIPSNILLAEGFAARFDGFSIGSNDLTQLTLGVDRDSTRLLNLFDERNEAVKILIETLIEKASAAGVPVGICGQGPSDYPEFAAFLVKKGISSISINPDSFLAVKTAVAAAEKR